MAGQNFHNVINYAATIAPQGVTLCSPPRELAFSTYDKTGTSLPMILLGYKHYVCPQLEQLFLKQKIASVQCL